MKLQFVLCEEYKFGCIFP